MLDFSNIRWIFGLGPGRQTDTPRLVASSQTQLSLSLKILPPGGAGWIGFEDIARLFLPDGDDSGRLDHLDEFAVLHRCEVTVAPDENRAYFAKIANATPPLPARRRRARGFGTRNRDGWRHLD